MKIFYAVQATGNGHISRAMELLPHLEKYGSVDIFLSGGNSNLLLDAPVKYRSKGISLFYTCTGGLDYWQFIKNLQPLRVRNEIRDLPVEKYDLVLNDFEHITSAACIKKNIPSIHFGHQASFQSPNTPRPEKKNKTGEWILKNFAKAPHHAGIHFKPYDDFILPAVVKKEILDAQPSDLNYITVYLPSWCEPQLKTLFETFTEYQFQVFSFQTKAIKKEKNITFIPVDRKLFNESLINCSGIITGGGFETPAEALHLGKKILSIPIKGQYEQQCNAAALIQLGVTCLPVIDVSFPVHFEKWIQSRHVVQVNYANAIPACIDYIFNIAESKEKMKVA